MKRMLVAFMTLLAIVLLTVEPGQAMSCEEIKLSLFPCLEYLTGGASSPSTACCSGVSSLKSSTPTKDDRRAACECLKDVASHFSGIREDLVPSLPKQCGVDVGFTISKDIKCSDIS